MKRTVTTVSLVCSECGIVFTREACEVRRQKAKRPDYRPTCSQTCRAAAMKGATNPNFGQRWSPNAKVAMAHKKMGTPSWNKGLTAETSESVRRHATAQIGNTRGRGNKGKAQPLTTWRNTHDNPMKRPEIRQKVSAILQTMDRSGPRAPNWKGGLSKYRGVDWPQQSELARQRDGRCCRICGRSDRRLNVHHITRYHICRHNELWNLVTLCASCHVRVEYGKIPCPTNPPEPHAIAVVPLQSTLG